jgi:hypothetical protein
LQLLNDQDHIATLGGFHESWVHSVKSKAHTNLGENTLSLAEDANAWCQIRA